MSIELIKADLTQARDREQADAIFKSAYAAGYTLQELGDIVGVTREYIRQRVSRPVNPHLMRTYDLHERVVRKQREYKTKRERSQRVLGLRLSSPALQVPVATLNEIQALRELATEVRGWTPLDAPARKAIEPFGRLLNETITEYEIPGGHLEKLFGLSTHTFRVWLKNHGYYKQSPSQKSYQGIYIDPKTRKVASGPRLVEGVECKRGHLMHDENIGIQKAGRYCKDCRKQLYRERKKSIEK